MKKRACASVVWCVGAAALASCGAAREGSSVVAYTPASRAGVFDAARDALRASGYTLDRVDSALGVLTTQSRASGGSPFTSSPASDVLHEQSRVVRVEFDDAGHVARVECFVSRAHTPDLQLATRAVGLSATSYDPTKAERGAAFRFTSALTRDEGEARRIAGRIRSAAEGTP